MKKLIYMLLVLPAMLVTACGGMGGDADPPTEITRDEIAEYFSQFPCGVDFTAMGSTDSIPCYRTPDGKAECIEYYHPEASILSVNWNDGEPVTDVLHVSGGGGKGGGIMVVTTDGKVYAGDQRGVDPIPVIAAGGIMVTASYTHSCAIIRQNDKNKVLCKGEGYQAVDGLPEDFDAMQIVSGGFVSCALDATGEAWCWQFTGSAQQWSFSTPMKFISFEKEDLCGVTFDGTVECLGSWSPSEPLYDITKIYGARFSLIALQADGHATYYRREISAPFDITDIVASTGTDDHITALSTQNGDVHLLMGDGITEKIPGATAQAAECPLSQIADPVD